MKFDKLNEIVPYARFGKQKSLSMSPYNGVYLAMPGRHAEDTTPKGGDFCVIVDDDNIGWVRHQFTHSDMFKDLELKYSTEPSSTNFFMKDYLSVIQGGNPELGSWYENLVPIPLKNVGVHPQTLLYALQCLAVAEHRRYAKHEERFGGRFLPFRFSAGIAQGLWTAEEASKNQRYGRSAVERLEKERGLPILTTELMQ